MLEQAVRAAASPLHVPGQVDWQVISPAQVETIAESAGARTPAESLPAVGQRRTAFDLAGVLIGLLELQIGP